VLITVHLNSFAMQGESLNSLLLFIYNLCFRTAKLALESGSVWLSKKTVTAWKLDKGKGDRTYEHEVTFSTTFATPPKGAYLITNKYII
jgi:hypothetical protein